jgi:hypothetical protein
VTSEGPVQTDSTYRLQAVNIKVQTDHANQPVLVTSAHILNNPEVTP